MKTLFLLLLIYFPVSTFCQASSSFCIGAIGMLSSGNQAQSLAQSFNSKSACIQLNTGMQVYESVIGRLQFTLDCNTNTTSLPFLIRLYPNPVINYVRVDGEGTSGNDENITISIIDATGRLLYKTISNAPALRTGLSYYWGWLKAGNYFLKVDGTSTHQIIPFIKMN